MLYNKDTMGKNKKKRNKVYQGQDAKTTQTSVTRISAVHRNPLSQWWHDKKRVAKPILITGGIVAGLSLLVVEVIRMMAG